MPTLSRRSFLATCPVAALPLLAGAATRPAAPVEPSANAASPDTPPPPPIGAGFPTQEPDLVREMVGVSHGNVARVRELVQRQPSLAKAAWDWGFGDWESALGAASHVGNREIAELLLANGARPSIFSAAMMGQLDVVKAFVSAMPGIQKTKGPHSITLLKHALAGGERAKAVAEYLSALGGADEKLVDEPLTAQDVAKLVGTYSFGSAANERIEIRHEKERAMFVRAGGSARGLVHLGGLEFCPVGAERVRIRFRDSLSGFTLAVHDPDVVLTARKLS